MWLQHFLTPFSFYASFDATARLMCTLAASVLVEARRLVLLTTLRARSRLLFVLLPTKKMKSPLQPPTKWCRRHLPSRSLLATRRPGPLLKCKSLLLRLYRCKLRGMRAVGPLSGCMLLVHFCIHVIFHKT